VPEQLAVPPRTRCGAASRLCRCRPTARKRPPRPMPRCVATLTATWPWS